MRDGATKARQPKPQENQQDFGRGAAAAVRSDCRTTMLRHPVHWASLALGGIVEKFDDARKIRAGLPQALPVDR